MTILVCQCGARINAPGARPGRRGRCPQCGATLIVPDALPTLEPIAPPRASLDVKSAAGYSVLADEAEKSLAFTPKRRRSVRTERRDEEPEELLFLEKGGLIARPSKVETHVRQSLLYPLWDAPGFLFLIFMTPVLATFGLLSLGLAKRYIVGQDLGSAATVLPPILPGLLFFLLALGYVFLFLNDVVRSSAYGDIHHPRSPSWSLSASAGAVARWVWALVCAVLVCSPLWWRLGREPNSLRDWLIDGALAVPVLLYAQMAIVAVILFDDPIAANPWTVFRALYRAGFDSIRVTIATATAIGLICLGGVGLLRLPMTLAVVATYGYGFASLYLALFVTRVLGLYFRRNAKRIGWFPERLRWGAK